VGMGHRLFLRLKRWGFMKYGLFGLNPVIKFFDGIKPRDFVVSRRLSRRTIDLMGFCKKKPPVSADGIAWGRG